MKIGSKPPEFKLSDSTGNIHSLADYAGKVVVLYFYPKDMTSGCTIEAQGFRDLIPKFRKLGVVVLGISPDDVKSHAKFCEKESLDFPLLSDIDHKVALQYGVWVEKSMYGRKYMGIQRDTFVIDRDGNLAKHFEKVKPLEHPAEVLEFVELLV